MVRKTIFSAIALATVAFGAANAWAERVLTIGVPGWPADFNFTTAKSTDPTAAIYRELSQSGVATATSSGLRLVAARGLRFVSDRELEVSLAERAVFSNGNPVTIATVVESLNQCPMAIANNIQVVSQSKSSLRLSVSSAGEDSRQQLVSTLTSCPINDTSVVSLMGAVYGSGTNVASIGNFSPIEYRPGRLVVFKGGIQEAVGPHSFDRIELKATDSPEAGLAALRVGNLAVFFSSDKGVLAEAARDTTLSVGNCGHFDYVSRANLSVPCVDGQLRVSEVKNG